MELKNSSLVRCYLVDLRLNTVGQTRLCKQLWLLDNCFQPSLRPCSKDTLPATDDHPGRIRRRHTALTPWQRICNADVLTPEQHDLLQLRIDRTNPRTRQQQIEDQL